MRNLEAIEKELTEAREALSSVKGTPAEVYSRIVGYYRSVRNWNLGKREEYGERLLFRINNGSRPAVPSPSFVSGELRLLLFTRSSCPGCQGAKLAADRLGIPVDQINADTSEGMELAVKLNVMSTPTAILFSEDGKELGRASNAEAIGGLFDKVNAQALSLAV